MRIDDIPLLKGLEEYRKENLVRLHMPGHFGKISSNAIEKLQQNLYAYDVTEVDGTDNLSNPTGMIKEALDKLSNAYESKRSFMLVNGSTSGVYAMIDAVTKNNDTIVVARNCHKSVSNIVEIKKLKTKNIYPYIDPSTGLTGEYKLKDIIEAVENGEKPKAVVLTYPNYWGITYDLEKISSYLKEKGVYLLIDEAHGAHLKFSDKLPKSSLEMGADIVVQSTHKMLPALTQTAILHCNKNLDDKIIEKVKKSIDKFTTTSPSYIFMASIDIARSYMENYGAGLLDTLYENVMAVRKKYEKSQYIKIVPVEDFCKLVIHTKIPADRVDAMLREKYDIQCEMSLGNNILFILGVARNYQHICKVVDSIIKITIESSEEYKSSERNIHYPRLEKVKESYEVCDEKVKKVDLKLAKGKICGEKIIPYPPGIPLIIEGEVFNEEVISIIKKLNLAEEVYIYE